MRSWMNLDSFLNGRDSRKMARNTYVKRLSDNAIAVRFHQTEILIVDKNGEITLDTGGWNTVTTRRRLNQLLRRLLPVRCFTTNYDLFLSQPNRRPIEFFDGMTLSDQTGLCTNYWTNRE